MRIILLEKAFIVIRVVCFISIDNRSSLCGLAPNQNFIKMAYFSKYPIKTFEGAYGIVSWVEQRGFPRKKRAEVKTTEIGL